ncbi:MAG TPA: hypothetical protein VK133_01880 [Amoebophilaceae bacterium]|nr:hypothetical protein [Amoebophilaceae bacterium]
MAWPPLPFRKFVKRRIAAGGIFSVEGKSWTYFLRAQDLEYKLDNVMFKTQTN